MADILLKFVGVTGESQVEQHTGWIEGSSFNESITAPVSTQFGTGAATGKPTFGEFSFTTVAGCHSIDMKKKMFQGEAFATVEVHFMKQTNQPFPEPYEIRKIEEAQLSHYSSSKGNDSLAYESYSLSAAKCEWEYKKQNPDQSLTSVGMASYDQKLSKAA